MTESHLVSAPADAERYLSIPRRVPQGDVTPFFAAQAAMGDSGIVEVSLGMNPAGTVAELCGSEAFAIMSLTDRGVLHALCQRELETTLAVLRYVLGLGLGPYFSMLGEEYLVPPLHGPHDFHDFNVRYDKPIVDLIHEAGGRIHIHSHGAIRRVFDGFLEIGADVLHPLEPPPMGDITAAQAKELAGDRLCLEGNLQIDRMYEATPDEVAAETAMLMRDAFGDHRGLIVSPSASPYIRGRGADAWPRYRAMIDTVLGYR